MAILISIDKFYTFTPHLHTIQWATGFSSWLWPVNNRKSMLNGMGTMRMMNIAERIMINKTHYLLLRFPLLPVSVFVRRSLAYCLRLLVKSKLFTTNSKQNWIPIMLHHCYQHWEEEEEEDEPREFVIEFQLLQLLAHTYTREIIINIRPSVNSGFHCWSCNLQSFSKSQRDPSWRRRTK